MNEYWDAIREGLGKANLIYNNIEKSRGGFYVNNPENRKKGRVGMRYSPNKGFESVSEYISKSIKNLDEFTKSMSEIREETGLILSKIGIKSKERIEEKANNDYNGDITKVKDIIRCTLINTKENSQNFVEQSLKKRFKNIEKKVQSAEDFNGYSGVIYRVQFENGCYGEVQFNHPVMIYLKESKESILKNYYSYELWDSINKVSSVLPGLGHKMYKEIRALTDKVKRGTASILEQEQLSSLKEKQRKYYSEFQKIIKKLK